MLNLLYPRAPASFAKLFSTPKQKAQKYSNLSNRSPQRPKCKVFEQITNLIHQANTSQNSFYIQGQEIT